MGMKKDPTEFLQIFLDFFASHQGTVSAETREIARAAIKDHLGQKSATEFMRMTEKYYPNSLNPDAASPLRGGRKAHPQRRLV